MKIIEVDEELYQYIASQTQSIGESASDILRRLLHFSSAKSAVKNEPVFTPPLNAENAPEAETASVAEASPNRAENTASQPPKKQSEAAISQLVGKVRALLTSETFRQESKAVVRFLDILRVLYRTNPESFAQATESLQGRTRVYFARDEATLLMAGNHTKPKQIPDTPYWVITNTNSGRKMLMLEGAMQSMHLPAELIDEVRAFFTAN